MKKQFKSILNYIGYDIVRYPLLDIRRRNQLFSFHGVNLILDVGANNGQYALEMRRLGYRKKIISFEPLSKAYAKLETNSMKDKLWSIYNYALGEFDGETHINISANQHSSSIKKMLDTHLDAAPESQYTGKETIKIKKLDSIFDSLVTVNDIVLLKIDTQGYEFQVLQGAIKNLKKIKLIQLEMPLIQLYENDITIEVVLDFMKENNFKLVSIENGFFDPRNGSLLQVDGFFLNTVFE